MAGMPTLGCALARGLTPQPLRAGPSNTSAILPTHALSRPGRQARCISANAQMLRRRSQLKQKKPKKQSPMLATPDLKAMPRFALCDAMRYIRAFEVGRGPTISKYEVHVRLKTARSGPVVRNRLRLPHTVDSSVRICVIAAEGGRAAAAARAAGAVLVGEESVFATVREGRIEFDRCICHEESLAALTKANLGRVLGPRGLMPSAKLGTVVKDVGAACRDMVGGSEYRERMGVVRMAVGQLGFTPEEMQTNLRAFLDALKRDFAKISDAASKEIHEVVLSSTNAPGFSLSGDFRSEHSLPTAALSTL